MLQGYVEREWHRKQARDKGKEIYPTVLPKLTFHYNPALAWQQLLDLEHGGAFSTPEEIAGRNMDFQHDVNIIGEWLDYLRGQFGGG